MKNYNQYLWEENSEPAKHLGPNFSYGHLSIVENFRPIYKPILLLNVDVILQQNSNKPNPAIHKNDYNLKKFIFISGM